MGAAVTVGEKVLNNSRYPTRDYKRLESFFQNLIIIIGQFSCVFLAAYKFNFAFEARQR